MTEASSLGLTLTVILQGLHNTLPNPLNCFTVIAPHDACLLDVPFHLVRPSSRHLKPDVPNLWLPSMKACQSLTSSSFAFETLGPTNQHGLELMVSLGCYRTRGDPKQTYLLFQCISKTVQCFNVIAFKEMFEEPDICED